MLVPGLGTRSLVSGVPNSRFFFFFSVENLYLYLVPGPWYLVYLTRDIFSAENLILYVRMDLVRIGIGNQPWLYIE